MNCFVKLSLYLCAYKPIPCLCAAIMIVSGDYIEMSIGVTLGISTLCAAALGNVIADVLGLNLGGVIEELSYKLGVPEPRLSRPQMEMKITRVVAVSILRKLPCMRGIWL